MRVSRAFSIAILLAVTGLGPGSLSDGAVGACASRLSCLGVRLPAAITITSGRVSFRASPDGRVTRIANAQSPFPKDAIWFPGTGTWYAIRQRHLVVGVGREPLWRSHDQISRNQLGLVAASSDGVAFQHDHQLYLAPLDGAERPVARRELPLGWTGGGLYTYRYKGRQLLLRSDRGRLLKVIARLPIESNYYVAHGTLYFIDRGVLMSAHGARIGRLASLNDLGLSAGAWMPPAGRMVELQDDHRLAVLRPDGSLFAWTPWPDSRGQAENISSALVLAPDASAVAFTAAAGQTQDPNTTRRARGTETVYLLPAGAETAIAVHREQVAFAPCERGAAVAWRGRWLLYGNSEGNLAVIDSAGTHRAIELGALVRRLPRMKSGFSAHWSGQPPPL